MFGYVCCDKEPIQMESTSGVQINHNMVHGNTGNITIEFSDTANHYIFGKLYCLFERKSPTDNNVIPLRASNLAHRRETNCWSFNVRWPQPVLHVTSTIPNCSEIEPGVPLQEIHERIPLQKYWSISKSTQNLPIVHAEPRRAERFVQGLWENWIGWKQDWSHLKCQQGALCQSMGLWNEKCAKIEKYLKRFHLDLNWNEATCETRFRQEPEHPASRMLRAVRQDGCSF